MFEAESKVSLVAAEVLQTIQPLSINFMLSVRFISLFSSFFCETQKCFKVNNCLSRFRVVD